MGLFKGQQSIPQKSANVANLTNKCEIICRAADLIIFLGGEDQVANWKCAGRFQSIHWKNLCGWDDRHVAYMGKNKHLFRSHHEHDKNIDFICYRIWLAAPMEVCTLQMLQTQAEHPSWI